MCPDCGRQQGTTVYMGDYRRNTFRFLAVPIRRNCLHPRKGLESLNCQICKPSKMGTLFVLFASFDQVFNKSGMKPRLDPKLLTLLGLLPWLVYFANVRSQGYPQFVVLPLYALYPEPLHTVWTGTAGSVRHRDYRRWDSPAIGIRWSHSEAETTRLHSSRHVRCLHPDFDPYCLHPSRL